MTQIYQGQLLVWCDPLPVFPHTGTLFRRTTIRANERSHSYIYMKNHKSTKHFQRTRQECVTKSASYYMLSGCKPIKHTVRAKFPPELSTSCKLAAIHELPPPPVLLYERLQQCISVSTIDRSVPFLTRYLYSSSSWSIVGRGP